MPVPYAYALAARFTLPAGPTVVVDFSTFNCVSIVEPVDQPVLNELVTIGRSRKPVKYGWWRDVQIQCVVDPGSADDTTLALIRKYMVTDGVTAEITLNFTDPAPTWLAGYFSQASRVKLQGVNVAGVYDLTFKVQDLLRDQPAGDIAGPPVMTQ